MTNYRLSRRADADLDEIFEYSAEQFGLNQARRYRDGLVRAFESLAANPQLGRMAKTVGAGVRRHEHKRHIILYEISEQGILILSLVHGRRRLNLMR